MTASYWKGLGLSLLLHLFQIPIAILLPISLIVIASFKPNFLSGVSGMSILISPVPAFIVSQFLYLVPAIIVAFRAGHRELGKGLITGAALSVMPSSACWTIFTGGNPLGPMWRVFTLQWGANWVESQEVWK